MKLFNSYAALVESVSMIQLYHSIYTTLYNILKVMYEKPEINLETLKYCALVCDMIDSLYLSYIVIGLEMVFISYIFI